MKRLIYIILTLILFGTSYIIYQKFFSPASLGERVFKDIENGKLNCQPTMTGSRLLLDLDDITTYNIIEDILLTSGIVPSAQNILDYSCKIFKIPSSIRKYKLIKSYNDTVSLLTSLRLDKKNYNDVYKSRYKTYQDYINKTIKLYSKEPSFRFDTLDSLIIYKKKPIKQIRLKYKVETPTENFLMDLVFIKIDGQEKLGAIFTTKN